MHSDELTDRLRLLSAVDISTLMQNVISDIRESIGSGDLQTAEYFLVEWEEAFGGAIPELVAEIRCVHRKVGYRAALAEFTIARRHRHDALEQFHAGLRSRQQRLIDRWRWVVSAYRADIGRFITDRQLILTNAAVLSETNPRIERQQPAAHGSFGRLLSIRLTQLDAAPAVEPEPKRLTIARVSELLDVLERVEGERNTEIRERDVLKIEADSLDRIAAEQIERLPTIASQIDAYRAILREKAHRQRIGEVASGGARLDGQIDELASSLSGLL